MLCCPIGRKHSPPPHYLLNLMTVGRRRRRKALHDRHSEIDDLGVKGSAIRAVGLQAAAVGAEGAVGAVGCCILTVLG